jgi:retron-type reverse transcriptase
MEDGGFHPTEEGVPQGGPLSPLCGNAMLNELDKELERRGHKFVRYADYTEFETMPKNFVELNKYMYFPMKTSA